MARTQTPPGEMGWRAVDFQLRGIDEQLWRLRDCCGERGLLVMFICCHCPYVQAIQEKIARDARELRRHGIASVAIMPNDIIAYPEDDLQHMREQAHHNEFDFPYLYDETQAVARAYGAVCTPDFFGFDAVGSMPQRPEVRGHPLSVSCSTQCVKWLLKAKSLRNNIQVSDAQLSGGRNNSSVVDIYARDGVISGACHANQTPGFYLRIK